MCAREHWNTIICTARQCAQCLFWHNKRSVPEHRSVAIQTESADEKYRLPLHPTAKSEYANRVSTRFCINFVFERAVPFSYRVIYTFPVYCHCYRCCCCCCCRCRCRWFVLWMLGRCWVFFLLFSFVRSFVRLKFCSLCFFPHSFAAFIRFSMLVLFLLFFLVRFVSFYSLLVSFAFSFVTCERRVCVLLGRSFFFSLLLL